MIEQTEIDRTDLFIEKIRDINSRILSRTGNSPTFSVLTFGCQMNAHDSEKIEGMLVKMGYIKSDSEREADLVIHNTCCVRENAENKVYGSLGILKHLKKDRPGMKVALCGCMMQQDSVLEKIKKTYRNVDIIFGTFNLHRFPELLHTNLETGETVIDIWEEHGEIVEELPVAYESKFKASVNIMYGCNNFCSYCIVPYVRGRERSREPEDILREVSKLAEHGVKEVLLLGQNVNSYGRGLGKPVTFAKLLQRVCEIDGIERIRFMTSHPKDMSDELIDTVAANEKLCKHIHLPLQSGSTGILREMNRRYTKEGYMELIDKIRAKMPDAAITTDIIVGFPGETDDDFEQTLSVIRSANYSAAYTFIYSKRTGTPAANMPEQVTEQVVKARFAKLLEVLNSGIYELNKGLIGKTVNVLLEDTSKQDKMLMTGRTDGNTLVHVHGGKSLPGEMAKVRITDCKTFYLIGEAGE